MHGTMCQSKIKKEIIKKFNISISKTYIYYIIRYKLNITYKQLRQKYYPEKKLSTLKKDKINFYNNIINQGIKKLISIDETTNKKNSLEFFLLVIEINIKIF
jgi:mannitol-specific phosphotransferase system IIBC component